MSAGCLGATVAAFSVWLCNSFQLYEFPQHTYYGLPYLIPVLIGIYGSMKQYKASKDSPIKRAIMLWMTSSIWLAITVICIFHIFPILNSGYPISDMVVHYMSFLLFIGFMLGVTRYRLFDIDRWWFNTWVMFLVTLGVLVVDAGVAYALNVSQEATFIIALLLFFLVYFPLREKLWYAFFRKKNGHNVKDYLSEIVTLFTQLKISEEEHEKYTQLFSFIYNPSDCLVTKRNNSAEVEPKLTNSGLVINVPINRDYSVIMTGKNRSRHLFDKGDEAFSKSIVTLASNVIELTKTRATIETDERSRIMRDLHDDVGAGLLNIIHGSKDQRAVSLARETLQSLRLSIIPLYQEKHIILSEAAAQWSREIDNRLLESNISFSAINSHIEGVNIEVRVFINTTRILRELTSNLIKHSDTKGVKLMIDVPVHGYLMITYDQLANAQDPDRWQAGTGLNNIDSRIKEIGGQIIVDQVASTPSPSVRYRLSIPLNE